MKVLVFGTFDVLHPGHRFVLNAAAARGVVHIVVARDSTVQRIKGHEPKQTELERCQAIQNEYPEAVVLLGDESNYLAPVQQVQPDLILLGYDQQFPPHVQESDLSAPIERLDAYMPDKYKSSVINT